MVKGILGSLAIHVAAFAVAWVVAYLGTNEYQDASDSSRIRGGEAVPQDQVMFDLSDAFGELLGWMFPVFLVGLVATILFLVISEGTKGVQGERGKMLPVWTMLLFAELIIAVVLMYVLLISPEVLVAMLQTNAMSAIAVAIVMMLLAYWISTLMFVKKLLVHSVPLATSVRGA